MSASSPSDTKATQRNWLPWVIGIVVLLFLAWWMRGCGKAPAAGMSADSLQTVDTTQTMAPAPVDTTTSMAPAPAATSAAPTDTAPAMKSAAASRTSTPSRADTIRAPATPPPPAEPTGPGAMGGRGEPGKKPPATTP